MLDIGGIRGRHGRKCREIEVDGQWAESAQATQNEQNL